MFLLLADLREIRDREKEKEEEEKRRKNREDRDRRVRDRCVILSYFCMCGAHYVMSSPASWNVYMVLPGVWEFKAWHCKFSLNPSTTSNI